MKLFTPTRLAKIAAAASVLSLFGAQTGLAAKNQSAVVFTSSRTRVNTTQTVLTGNSISVSQVGGFFANQSANVPSVAVSGVSSNVSATSGNVVVISQD